MRDEAGARSSYGYHREKHGFLAFQIIKLERHMKPSARDPKSERHEQRERALITA